MYVTLKVPVIDGSITVIKKAIRGYYNYYSKTLH